ncbi:MAG TPA: LysR family transcriptional regulator [Devosiaceae bacterium]|jgi:DNA-binding transcriptional LysR family regulator|nr:LysR family transcriptional regulator [Devosiaceae bacterium]
MGPIDWDDLRYVLAVARRGTASGAAELLGVNATTVARRIAALEAGLGLELFQKRQSGYLPTPTGEEAAKSAAAMEREVEGLRNGIAAQRRVTSGLVRFTCPETIASYLVAPWLVGFRNLYPAVRIEVINADAMLDLGKGAADVAMRVGMPPSGTGIVARRLPDCLWTAYCSRAYARSRGAPASPGEMRHHALVGLEGHMAQLPSSVWFEQMVGADRIPLRCNSLGNVVETIKADLGVAMLPCLIGDLVHELVRCYPPIPELNAQMWLIVREDLKTAPHVRAFVDFLAHRLTTRPGSLSPAAPLPAE